MWLPNLATIAEQPILQSLRSTSHFCTYSSIASVTRCPQKRVKPKSLRLFCCYLRSSAWICVHLRSAVSAVALYPPLVTSAVVLNPEIVT